MKFLRHLLGITKLDKGRNQCIREKTGAEHIVKEIKQYQEKWLQHIQRMDTNRIPKQALQYKPKGHKPRTKTHRMTEEEMEGPISFWGYKEKESNRILPEHDDGDEKLPLTKHTWPLYIVSLEGKFSTQAFRRAKNTKQVGFPIGRTRLL